MKKKSIVIIVLFTVYLVTPFAFQTVMEEGKNISTLLRMDQMINISNFNDYTSNLEKNFTDHTPFKSILLKTYANLNYTLFNQINSKNTILGKDGWLFYVGENKSAINDYIADDLFTITELNQIKETLLTVDEWCSANDIHFVFMMIPNKEYIYSQYLPNGLLENSTAKKIDQVYDYLTSNTSIKVSYPKEDLLHANEIDITYYKYDTHWNSYGAYIGYKNLATQLNISSNPLDAYQFSKHITTQGDLVSLASLDGILPPVASNELVSNIYDFAIQSSFPASNSIEVFNPDTTKKDILFFAGDSFRGELKKYLVDHYDVSYFQHRGETTFEHISASGANTLVLQIVERYLPSLTKPVFK